MSTWRVHDVMTTDVITAPDDATVADIVALLTDRQITAVAITDRFDAVLGVVSWTDLRRKIELAAPGDAAGDGRSYPWAPVRWPEGTAVEVMSGPALTIGADASLPTAARVMYQRGVGRLLVVDGDRKLRGIVTRSDLLKVHARLDAVIREEVLHQVLGDPLRVPPGTVEVAVEGGVVTLTGRIPERRTAVVAARLTAAVPGVADVVDRLESDVDDAAAVLPAHRPGARDPLRGWWPIAGHRQPKPPLVAVAEHGRRGGSR
jgi:CBS domain-containing protein